MGVYIKGMEMPKSCYVCRFCDGTEETEIGVCAYCCVDGGYREAYASNDFPLVPVPPHGRLIDADALVADTSFYDGGDWHYGYSTKQIDNAPTIIEAEEG